MKIFKYHIRESKPTNIIKIPIGAKILSAKVIDDDAYIWALVDPNNRLVNREILSWTTGVKIPEDIQNATFIDTLIFDEGEFVCHIFAVSE